MLLIFRFAFGILHEWYKIQHFYVITSLVLTTKKVMLMGWQVLEPNTYVLGIRTYWALTGAKIAIHLNLFRVAVTEKDWRIDF